MNYISYGPSILCHQTTCTPTVSVGIEIAVIDEPNLNFHCQVYRTYMLDRQGWPIIANLLNQTPGISLQDYDRDFAETHPPPPDTKIL